MVISPLVVWAALRLDRRWLRRLGAAGCAVGLAGLLAVLGWAILTWKTRYGAMTGPAVGLRFAYLLATGTELPVVPVGLAGAVIRAVSSRRGRNPIHCTGGQPGVTHDGSTGS